MDPVSDYFRIQLAEMVDFTEECDKQVQWAQLPSIPLEGIYSFLLREDQINMSQVCRNWSEGFSSPSVWKKFMFSLTEAQLSMDPCPKIKCAEKYSRMFRHVEIDCIRNADEHLIETGHCKKYPFFPDFFRIFDGLKLFCCQNGFFTVFRSTIKRF
ncbi:hypothetical protein AVEN_215439-1 [Araneus ventricosus]|uniref:F-box domain-containing protein n=1 Tax=Araneus ventricosus TaxID=182803 RepID=A0A4Y2NAS5_ARAVE|nr:hypothetical protein AVEN_215439-1 [Araneus ventricosus]